MLKDESDIETLSRRCNEFEMRIAVLENAVALNTAHNSNYAAALKVYREYRSDDKNYSTGGFVEFCEKRLH